MEILKKISSSVDNFTERLSSIVNWLTLVMIAVAVYNALGRYAGRFVGINLSSNFFLELQWYLFSMVFLLGASSALARNAHVRVDVISSKFSPVLQAKIDFAGGILFLLPFCVFMIAVSIPSVSSSWSVFEQSPDPGGIARYPIKTIVPVAFLILFLQGISELIKAFFAVRGIKKDKPSLRDTHGGGV